MPLISPLALANLPLLTFVTGFEILAEHTYLGQGVKVFLAVLHCLGLSCATITRLRARLTTVQTHQRKPAKHPNQLSSAHWLASPVQLDPVQPSTFVGATGEGHLHWLPS
jgi:hypothetical protein